MCRFLPTRLDDAILDPLSNNFYHLMVALARLAVRSGRSKNLQIIVLRHQIQVVRHRIGRPAVNNNDQTLLAAIAAALPHRLRQGWIVTPHPPDSTAPSTSTRMQPDQGRVSEPHSELTQSTRAPWTVELVAA